MTENITPSMDNFQSAPKPGHNTIKWVLGCCLGAIILCLAAIILLYQLGSQKSNEEFSYNTVTDPTQLVDISIELADSLHLENVDITETAGNIIEVRTPAPYNVSTEAIAASAVYIFTDIDPEIATSITKYRLILTVNYIDSLIIETDRDDVTQLNNQQIDQNEFIRRLTITNLT